LPLAETDAYAGQLNNLERLILAQAVYELGSNAWTAVSNILTQHPLIIKRDDLAFSPTACQNTYDHLIESLGLDSAEPEKQPRNGKSIPVQAPTSVLLTSFTPL
jgi:bromodomain-containing protein 8